MDRAELLLTPARSVLLALWGQHLGSGAVPLRSAIDAVEGDDEPHVVDAASLGPDGPTTLPDLLADWAEGSRTLAAALPSPGDLAGVPAAVSGAAADAGECVLARTANGTYAAVPVIEEFGSVYETGHLVTWTVHRVPEWQTVLMGAVGSLAEAERDLRTALLASTDALASLDVARWRPDAAEAIATLRSQDPAAGLLPPTLDPRRVRVLTLALRLRGIVALATADDGGAVNLWQADQRSTALREIDRAARRALSSATLVTDDHARGTAPLGG
ncbi:hypothetical protein [Actinotalea sp. K2]|uniref:hypothetical protein n=1 Tax=Actinotalea sp. K2 TaxID=2939438 RepID=UPI0020174598|nr:hypothetical protein [Actinotalea sp. K2]MCL3861941.1 hypothetical protein [Actinotalea sp. K2]